MNPDYITLNGDEALVTPAWLKDILKPTIKQLREDSAECGEDILDDDDWHDLLVVDMTILLIKEAAKSKPRRFAMQFGPIVKARFAALEG